MTPQSSFSSQVPPRAVLRMKDAAHYLAISRSHLYELIAAKELRQVKLGGTAAGILISDLDAWLLKQRDASNS